MLNQVAVNYIGKFMDDRLHINAGLRAPYFKRDLNQFCYTYNGTTVQCDTVDQSLVTAALAKDIAAFAAAPVGSKPTSATNLNQLLFGKATGVNFDQVTGQPNFRLPFRQTFNFNKVLPNAGVSYRINDDQMVYATYAEGFSAPKTDDLYSSSTAVVQPETSESFAAGWRYQSSAFTTSFSAWGVKVQEPDRAVLRSDRSRRCQHRPQHRPGGHLRPRPRGRRPSVRALVGATPAPS